MRQWKRPVSSTFFLFLFFYNLLKKEESQVRHILPGIFCILFLFIVLGLNCQQAWAEPLDKPEFSSSLLVDNEQVFSKEKIEEFEGRLKEIHILSTGIPIGTNKTINGATAGATYVSHSSSNTVAAYGLNDGGWLDCKAEFMFPGKPGSGYAWGWIGSYINITGSGSRKANIIVNGSYNGVLQTDSSTISKDAGIKIYIQVVDVSNNSFNIIAERKVVDRNISVTMWPNEIMGTINSNHTVSCTLQAGKNYLVRIRVYVEASANAPLGLINTDKYENYQPEAPVVNWAVSNFYDGGKGGKGVDITDIKIIWQ